MTSILEIIIFIIVIKNLVKYFLIIQENKIYKIQKIDNPKNIYYINDEIVSIQTNNNNQTDYQIEIDNEYWEPIIMNKSVSYFVVNDVIKRENLTVSNWVM